MAESPRYDVVCVGEVLVDFFATTEGPLQGVDLYQRQLGGAPANVAVALSRLGARVALLAQVGRDPFGEFLRSCLETERVSTALLASCGQPTGLAFVSRLAGGERNFVFYRDGSADMTLQASQVHRVRSAIENAGVMHLCGNGLAQEPVGTALREAVTIASDAETCICFDLNLRPHLWASAEVAGQVAGELVPHCTIVKADREEAEAVTGLRDPLAAAQALVKLGPQIATVTLGEGGAVFATAAGAGRVRGPAAGPIIDTTGAGDAFCAALVHGFLAAGGSGAEFSVEQVKALVYRACAAGALACGEVGATSSLADTAQLDALCRS